jgi:hypothetical protein
VSAPALNGHIDLSAVLSAFGAKRTSGEAAACFGPTPIGDIDRFEIPQRGSRLCYFFCSEAGEGTER